MNLRPLAVIIYQKAGEVRRFLDFTKDVTHFGIKSHAYLVAQFSSPLRSP